MTTAMKKAMETEIMAIGMIMAMAIGVTDIIMAITMDMAAIMAIAVTMITTPIITTIITMIIMAVMAEEVITDRDTLMALLKPQGLFFVYAGAQLI